MPDIEELRSIAIEHGVDPTYLDSPDALCARGHRRGDHGDGVAHTACCADLVCECDRFISGAVLSPCGRYRYELRRMWDPTGPVLEFIMLNPSAADESADDPTIRRCIGFAKRWGYGGIVVRNRYAWRATNPAELAIVDDPVGPENHDYLSRTDADCTIAAWGANPAAVAWSAATRTVIQRPRLLCLGVNANGSPKHPLYVPSSRTPTPWVVPDA